MAVATLRGNGNQGAARPANQLPPFERRTDPRRQQVVVGQAIAAGAQFNKDLPQVGFFAGLYIRASATVTLITPASGVAAFSNFGPWNLLSRILVKSNLGAQDPIDIQGWQAAVRATMQHRNFGPDDSPNYAAGLSESASPGTANSWMIEYYIPIGLNRGMERRWGLINLQSIGTHVTLYLTAANMTDIVTNFGASSAITNLTVDVYYDFYSIPKPGTVSAYPDKAVHYLLQDQQPISTVGDQVYRILPQGTLLRYFAMPIINGKNGYGNVGPAVMNEHRLRYNRSSTPWDETGYQNLFSSRERYGQNSFFGSGSKGTLPPATFPQSGNVYVFDRWNAMGQPSTGPLWDAINTQGVTVIEAVHTIAGGTALASGDALYVVRELIQRLA